MITITENIVSLIKMKKKLPFRTTVIGVLAFTFLQSCVPHRKYATLEEQYNALIDSNDSCRNELSLTKTELNDIESKANDIYAENADLEAKFTETEAMFTRIKASYEALNENYKELIASKSEDLAELDAELKDLEAKLSEKDDDLSSREADLIKQQSKLETLAKDIEQLRLDLEAREKKVEELEEIIAQKEKAFADLTTKIKQAITAGGVEGLTVEQKNGKIYVSVESALLFKPGRTDIDTEGEKALLNLSETLANLEDIEIIVEGHTDKQPIKTARFNDNWDLSVLRATSVVRLFVNKGGLSPNIVVPSGRAQYIPLAEGSSAEDYAKNRRIEIIISPNLSKVYELIQN